MDEKKILKNFENIRFTADEEQEIASAFPQYILYRREKKRVDGYCTGCKQYLELERYCKPVKHGLQWQCPNCGAKITFLAGGKVPAATHRISKNFLLLRAIDGDLYMRSVKVYQFFEHGSFDEWNGISDYDTIYEPYGHSNYWCGKDGAVQWNRYGAGWLKLKTCNEPYFAEFFDGTRDYRVIGLEQIGKSDLKYCGYEKFIELCGDTASDCPLVKFLCMSAKYPSLEKLMKSGFEYIVKDKLLGGRVRLNYCGETPQKILRLNTAEIKALQGISASEYNDYLYFRKNIHVSGRFAKRLKWFEQFGMIANDIVETAERTGLSHEKVMNYINRQTNGNKAKNYLFMRDWKDHLCQCEDLGYDITDEAICKPADFYKMHERLSMEVKARKDKITWDNFMKNYEQRRELEFFGEEFIVIQPHFLDEIIKEGEKLRHCVGGYANRHARGELTIMFLREKSKPDKPFYTIEVSNKLKIVQCRGYRNNNADNSKPKAIEDFEKVYQEYLDSIVRSRAKKERTKNDRIGNKNTAGGRKPRGNGRIHQGGEPSLQDNACCTTRAAVAV